MAHPLYLTADERKLFTALSAKLREGWEVKEEKGKYEDSPERQEIRYELLKLNKAKYKKIVDKANTVRSQEEFHSFVMDVDFSSMTQDELIDVLFTVGPDIVSLLISHGIATAKEDSDVELIAAFTNFRHLVLASYSASR